ncbi:hypothetical protein D3C78_1088350 [compost metagenome]
MTTQSILLAVRPEPFTVVVAFVTGDHQHGTYRLALPCCFKQIDRANHIGRIGIQRCAVGLTHQRLGGQVQNNLGPGRIQGFGQTLHIPDVGQGARNPSSERSDIPERRLGVGRQRVTVNMSAQLAQPQRQPASLETGMSGQKHPAS